MKLFYANVSLNEHLYIPIIITKNNYKLGLFNGQTGVLKIQKTLEGPFKEKAYFKIDNLIQDFEISYLSSYEYAYSISIHKSQGSEYPAVVVPLVTQHFALLQRNLLYTAITRGKRVVVLIGSRKAVRIALNNDKPRRRSSKLYQRIIDCCF